MPLDRDRILAAALDIIDRDGLDGFSLRALGRSLGTSQMAAYRYFGGKAEILNALADQLLDEIRLSDPSSVPDPKERILGYCHRARSVLLQHPALVPVVAARVQATQAADVAELVVTFSAAGFPDDFIFEAVSTLMAVTLGLVLYEQQRTAHNSLQGDRDTEESRKLEDEPVEVGSGPAQELAEIIGSEPWFEQLFTRVLHEQYAALQHRAAER